MTTPPPPLPAFACMHHHQHLLSCSSSSRIVVNDGDEWSIDYVLILVVDVLISLATPPQSNLYTRVLQRIAGFHRAQKNKYGPLSSRNNQPTTKSNLLNDTDPFCKAQGRGMMMEIRIQQTRRNSILCNSPALLSIASSRTETSTVCGSGRRQGCPSETKRRRPTRRSHPLSNTRSSAPAGSMTSPGERLN